jgi:hypothetical protein
MLITQTIASIYGQGGRMPVLPADIFYPLVVRGFNTSEFGHVWRGQTGTRKHAS